MRRQGGEKASRREQSRSDRSDKKTECEKERGRRANEGREMWVRTSVGQRNASGKQDGGENEALERDVDEREWMEECGENAGEENADGDLSGGEGD